MPAKGWNPGRVRGTKQIPRAVKQRTAQRIRRYGEEHFAGQYLRLDIRFKDEFCYIDAYQEVPANWSPNISEEIRERWRTTPNHLCRLRYFGDEDHWGFAIYDFMYDSYSAIFTLPLGGFFGTPEEAFHRAAELGLIKS
jgi:hypothetical protein